MEQVRENKVCAKCQITFPITEQDEQFYAAMAVPKPTLCPECRQQRRLAWRNERTLYKRLCSATQKPIVSVFSEDKPFPVYENEYWFSDKWNALDYGRDFDFSRPFFEQFAELMNVVPQLARSAAGNYNSEYVNQCGWSKNCYLTFEADCNEDCLYATHLYDSRVCMDVLQVQNSELLYESINCKNSYNLKFSQNCDNCSDSAFLKNCIGCKNCFGCVNLRNKEFYFFNEQCTPEQYRQKMAEVGLDSQARVQELKTKFADFVRQFPQRYFHGTNNYDSTGDYLWDTKNCQECFDVFGGQDSKFVFNARNVKNVYDMTVFGSQKGAEFCYECHEIGDGVRNIYFSDQVWSGCSDIFYSKMCINSSNHLFGCVGLKHAAYCILNKQYTKEEYEELLPRIIEHMKAGGEFGEFFPIKFSPFAYNETDAQDYFPLSKEQAVSLGYKWKELDDKAYQAQIYVLPDRIGEVKDDILKAILACAVCGKNYKIIPQELQLYRRWNVAVPRMCFECRNLTRRGMRNPRKLWERNCNKCQKPIQTTYASDCPEKVNCEECYLEAVY